MPPKKFYAVRRGRQLGVYASWEECKVQISGFPGAVHQSFRTEAEAVAFVGETPPAELRRSDTHEPPAKRPRLSAAEEAELCAQFRLIDVQERLPPLSSEQQQVVQAALAGRNLFVTGGAGVGKSVTLRSIVAQLKARGKRVAVTGSTGVAADNVQGMTLHKWAGCGVPETVDKIFKMLSQLEIRDDDVLIVDEISMVSGELLDGLAELVSQIRGKSPFGGLQVIFFGDFLQLKPVNPAKDFNKDNGPCPAKFFARGYAFQSKAWAQLDLQIKELTEVYRQQDKAFAKFLNAVRFNDVSTLEWDEFMDETVGGGQSECSAWGRADSTSFQETRSFPDQ